MVGHTTYDYSGESAIVTGSTKGIGRGIAEGLADAGANVVVNSRTEEDVTSVAEELDERSEGDVIGVTADMANPTRSKRSSRRRSTPSTRSICS